MLNSGTTWHNKLTFNGTLGDPAIDITDGNQWPRPEDGNLLGVDPRFVRAAAEGFDVRLAAGSLAIGAGSNAFGLGERSLVGQACVVNTIDIGAYEH